MYCEGCAATPNNTQLKSLPPQHNWKDSDDKSHSLIPAMSQEDASCTQLSRQQGTTEIIVNGMISECAWIYNIQHKDSPQKALSTVETCAIAASPATEEHATRRIAGGRTTPSSNGDNELRSAFNSSDVMMRNNSDDKIQKTQKPTCECVSNKEQWICRLSVYGRKLSKCLLWISYMKRDD